MTTRRPGDHSRLVTAVVCAAFGSATDAAILAVRERVRGAGIDLPPQPPHRPHFSRAAARVGPDAELDRVLAAAVEVAARHAPIDLVLAEVGRFGRAGVLWLGPATSGPLAALQRDAAEALCDAGWPPAFGIRGDAAHWTPHCTLATRLPTRRLRDLQAVVRSQYRPIHGTVDALATILVGGRGDVGHARLHDPGP